MFVVDVFSFWWLTFFEGGVTKCLLQFIGRDHTIILGIYDMECSHQVLISKQGCSICCSCNKFIKIKLFIIIWVKVVYNLSPVWILAALILEADCNFCKSLFYLLNLQVSIFRGVKLFENFAKSFLFVFVVTVWNKKSNYTTLKQWGSLEVVDIYCCIDEFTIWNNIISDHFLKPLVLKQIMGVWSSVRVFIHALL